MIQDTEYAADDAKTLIFAINPNSGASDRSKLCRAIADQLVGEGFICELLTDLDEVVSATRKHLSSGDLRAVVAAGGDGTVSLLANLLPRETPFAILPLGTENLLGRHLGLKAEATSFIDLVKTGKILAIDAGEANGKLFFVVASCGFDAAVVKRLDEVRSGHINYLSWVRPSLQTVSSYQFPPLKLTIDGEVVDQNVRWAFVFNIPRYAMRLRITPDADDDDGRLDLCTFRNGGVFRGIWYMLTTWLGLHANFAATQFAQFESLKVESDFDGPVYFELDGDPGGELPLEILVRPKALRVLVPDSRN